MTHGTPDKELEVIPLSRKDSGLRNCTTGNAKGVILIDVATHGGNSKTVPTPTLLGIGH